MKSADLMSAGRVYQNVTRGPEAEGPGAGALGGRVVLLQPQLSGRLAAPSGGFLARQVAHTQVGRVDHQALAVDQDLGLARGGFDDRGPLQHGRHPDAAAVDLGFEVGKDLVILVHLDAVQPDQLSAARLLSCGFSVRIHAHMPDTRSRAGPNPTRATEADTPGRYRTDRDHAVLAALPARGMSPPTSGPSTIRTV